MSRRAGDDWVHELKYDGYRLLIAASGDDVRCYTRSGQDWTTKFPRDRQMLSRAMDLRRRADRRRGGRLQRKTAAPIFRRSQQALSENGPIEFFAFDLLEESGEDLTGLPLVERKQPSAGADGRLPKKSPLHFSTHIEGQGKEVFARICEAGHEGIVSKKATSRYVGDRTKTWLKVKCTKRQEFVIGGWTPSDKRTGFRSLLLGIFEKSKLRLCRAASAPASTRTTLEDLSARFKKLARKDSPFEDVPRDVAREGRMDRAKARRRDRLHRVHLATASCVIHPFTACARIRRRREVKLERPQPVEKAMGEEAKEIVKAGIRITHPDRVVFPDRGLTKNDLARILRGGRRADAAACREAAAQPCPLPLRRRPQMLLPEARHRRLSRRDEARADRRILRREGAIFLRDRPRRHHRRACR